MAPAPAALAATLFRALSRWRGRRAFHPFGVGFEAELRQIGGSPDPLLVELRERDQAELEFELAIAGLRGAPRSVARLRLGRRLPRAVTERLGFDPCNSGGGLEPTGPLNRLRGPSYSASQKGRATAYARRGPGEE